ncbi:hypothetical protein LCGC14_1910070 [marine sediment metagenome]|uniref:Uncharacterized protein n=1 Tax=marine sediment metagenome TaxID=412755 RepID=A0A0F9FUG2_9ZZZZ
MPYCPECDANIDFLYSIWNETIHYQEHFSGSGFEGDVEEVDSELNGSREFECPECGDVILRTIEAAEEFFEEETPRQNPNSDIRINNV